MVTLSEQVGGVNQPPFSNTGVGVSHIQSLVFSFDWLRLTVWTDFAGIQPLLALLGVDVGLENTGHGGLGFRSVWAGLHGFQLYCEPVNENQIFVSVNLPSKCIQAVGLEKWTAAYTWLCEQGLSGLRWGCTRLDLAFDTQGFTVQQFADAYRSGDVVTKTRKWNEITGDDGHTFYVGSRQSDALLRVYHKTDGCSFGDDAFTRVELELKSDRASAALLHVMASPQSEWSQIAEKWLSGFIQVRASWWEDFLGNVRSAWLKLRRRVSTVGSIGGWLRAQVAPSLAVYVQAVCQGETSVLVDEINALLKDGQSRFTRRHNQLIQGNLGDGVPEFAVYSFG